MKNIKKAGFTLLEMLVVIGIIGILASISFASYGTVQKKARDAKIKSDMKSIQDAMEQYYSVCGYAYPNVDSGHVPVSIICPSPSIAIMPTVPVEPKLGTRYTMSEPDATNATYQICSPNTPPLESEGDGSTPYCLTNQQ